MQTDSIEHDRQIALQSLKGLDLRGYSAMSVHAYIINEYGVHIVNLNPASKTFERLMDEQTKRLVEEAKHAYEV